MVYLSEATLDWLTLARSHHALLHWVHLLHLLQVKPLLHGWVLGTCHHLSLHSS
jgi:hypothetical protein